MNTQQSVCFAYFGDGRFLGWYADSFGSIRPQSPKVYSSLDSMRTTITNNFRNKVVESRSGEDPSLNIPNRAGAALVNNSLKADAVELSQYKSLELRAVACPHYDGPNPDFDQEAFDALLDERQALFNAEGINNLPVGSIRTAAVEEFNTRHPRPKCDNWIYADYSKVKEWASNEPTEFLEVITAQ